MKALLAGQRQGSVGVVAGLLAVLCLAVSCAGLILKQMRDLHDVKQTLISRCQIRQAADAREREDLQARIDLYAKLLTVQQDAAIPYRQAMAKAQGTLDGMPKPVDCAHVYAAPR